MHKIQQKELEYDKSALFSHIGSWFYHFDTNITPTTQDIAQLKQKLSSSSQPYAFFIINKNNDNDNINVYSYIYNNDAYEQTYIMYSAVMSFDYYKSNKASLDPLF